MIVLKFGGSSVAGADEVEQVLAVLSQQKKPMAVVVSALGGITDELHALGKLAADGDTSYADRLKQVEERHVMMVQALIPVSKRSAILSTTKQIINKLETILEGTFMIRELSPKTRDTLLSFGEILSHKIIAEAAKAKGIDAIAKNAQDLIVTFQSLGRTLVDYKKTNANLRAFFKSNKNQVVILPGFVSKNAEGIVTTLGRGGSDLTASTTACALAVSYTHLRAHETS